MLIRRACATNVVIEVNHSRVSRDLTHVRLIRNSHSRMNCVWPPLYFAANSTTGFHRNQVRIVSMRNELGNYNPIDGIKDLQIFSIYWWKLICPFLIWKVIKIYYLWRSFDENKQHRMKLKIVWVNKIDKLNSIWCLRWSNRICGDINWLTNIFNQLIP